MLVAYLSVAPIECSAITSLHAMASGAGAGTAEPSCQQLWLKA